MIRVAHLVTNLHVGGLEKVVYNLVRFSDRNEFCPTVICLRKKGSLAPEFEPLGVPVHSLDGEGSGRSRMLYRLVRRLRELRVQVLHTHNPIPHYFGVMARSLTPIPVLVHTKHGRNRPDIARRVALNHLAARLSSCVVTVSGNATEVARQTERVPRRKLRLIRNGIDVSQFDRGQRSEETVKCAIHVARLNIIKDQKTLLRAVRMVVDACPDFHLDIAGDGEERKTLECFRDELGLGRHVSFLGERSDISALLARSGLFVLSSIGEGLSLTLLEAMASGLPVVATNVGGNPEVVVDGHTGILVPPRAPAELSDAILSVVRDPRRALWLGDNGRRRVETEFDMRRVASRYEDLYRALLDCS
jgi:glycosyltransferase involved in cell wall biosynthesis